MGDASRPLTNAMEAVQTALMGATKIHLSVAEAVYNTQNLKQGNPTDLDFCTLYFISFNLLITLSATLSYTLFGAVLPIYKYTVSILRSVGGNRGKLYEFCLP